MAELQVTWDELPGLFQEGDELTVNLAQVPMLTSALRELADRLDAEYEEAE